MMNFRMHKQMVETLNTATTTTEFLSGYEEMIKTLEKLDDDWKDRLEKLSGEFEDHQLHPLPIDGHDVRLSPFVILQDSSRDDVCMNIRDYLTEHLI